jgi:hypothetical protein
MLTRSEYDNGVVEFETRFLIACTACKRFELRGALPNPLDLEPERSPVAKRLRATCKWRAPLPCAFERRSGMVKLTHAQALAADLCGTSPIMRLMGDDGEAVMASRLPQRDMVSVIDITHLAMKAFQDLGDGTEG